MFYYQQRTQLQRLYYDFHLQNGRGSSMLGFITEPHLQYLARYQLLNLFHRNLHPFSFLKEGDKALMVGFHDGFINLGYSTLLIMAALVGPEGHVWGVDPDERNIKAAAEFIETNDVKNVTLVQKGVWEEKGKLDFTFYADYSSSNTITELHETNLEAETGIWGKDRIRRESGKVSVEVDTIDNIAEEFVGGGLDFINLTINGAEPEAIEGADKCLNWPGVSVAFPINDPVHPVFNRLEKRGFRIAVANAPTKAWDDAQFLYACATRVEEAELENRGYVPSKIKRVSETAGQNAPSELVVTAIS